MKYIKLFENINWDEFPAKLLRQDTKLVTDNYEQLLKENCSEYLKYHNPNYYLARLVPMLETDEAYLIDPLLHERKSIDGLPNIYTLIMDNEPEWVDYPKRKNSLCCYYQDEEPVGDYFIVIPYDGAKFGVTPQYDLWRQWRNKLNKHGIEMSVSTFLYLLEDIYKQLSGEKFETKDYDILKQQINELDDYLKTHKIDEDEIGINRIIKIIKQENLWNFLTDDIFTPEGFEVVDIKGLGDIEVFADLDSKEVWTHSKCLLIGPRLYQKIKNNI